MNAPEFHIGIRVDEIVSICPSDREGFPTKYHLRSGQEVWTTGDWQDNVRRVELALKRQYLEPTPFTPKAPKPEKVKVPVVIDLRAIVAKELEKYGEGAAASRRAMCERICDAYYNAIDDLKVKGK